ncbi:MAG: CPBP family intramembrane glutamic endopeptidase [Candidatus Sulfotelmatobacter sp.]
MKADTITISFLLWVLVLMPVLGFLSWRWVKLGKPLRSKGRRYRTMIALQVFLLVITSLAAKQNNFSLFGPAWPPAWTWVAAAAYLVFIAVRVRTGWRKLSEERKQKARLTLPENPAEMRYWVPISLLAGVTEEYAYRGVAYSVLSQITGSPGIALVVCVLSFSIAHMMQGWRATMGIALLAILFHITVFLTQSLYLVIAFHVAYDLAIGFLGMRALAGINPPETQPAF